MSGPRGKDQGVQTVKHTKDIKLVRGRVTPYTRAHAHHHRDVSGSGWVGLQPLLTNWVLATQNMSTDGTVEITSFQN